jgi:cation transport ATPase
MAQTTTSPTSFDFTVEGMTCGSCATGVQRILRREPDVESAHVHYATPALIHNDLAALTTAIRLSRRIHCTIVQNLGSAFGYSVLAIPLAAAGFLNPIIAGAAMGLSTVSVVTNSLRLRHFAQSPTAQ